MKLFRISQESQCNGWDYFDSAVIACETVEEARNMHPGNGNVLNWDDNFISEVWAKKPSDVLVEYLGEADESVERGVICSSFNT